MQETRQTRTNRPYELVEYDENWLTRFSELRDFLMSVFEGEALKIEHIGSTSIPGMIAKPIIDAVVVVDSLESVKGLYDIFKKHSYECKGNFTGLDEEYFTFTNPEGKRVYNVHVMQEGNPHIREQINFRDFMRSNPDAMQEYREIKLGLKEIYGTDDYNSYDHQKGILMEQLKVRAKKWANKIASESFR